MDRRISHGLTAALAATAAATGVANAQSGTENYYNPPKLVSQGKSALAIAGPGKIVVQVLVAANGSAKSQRVIKSSNHADDALALDIAKHSTYRAGTRGGKPIVAFYDYTLTFSGTSASADAGTGDPLASYDREIRAGDYAGAQSGLRTYVAAHPDSAKAQSLLAVADTFLNQDVEAAAAFDKAGTIADPYKALAAKAYAEAASDLAKDKDYPGAVAAAKKSAALSPGFFTQNTLGYSEYASGDYQNAIADLEKARALGAADAKIKPTDRAQVDANLMSAYLAAGKPDMAKPLATEIGQLDPGSKTAQNVFANYYVKQAQDASAAGKAAIAAGLYEQAAAAAPSQAVTLYGSAALAYLNAKPDPDNARAKADAEKALALDPSNAAANYALGISYANQSGHKDDALKYLKLADASVQKSSDTTLAPAIAAAIKQLSGTK